MVAPIVGGGNVPIVGGGNAWLLFCDVVRNVLSNNLAEEERELVALEGTER